MIYLIQTLFIDINQKQVCSLEIFAQACRMSIVPSYQLQLYGHTYDSHETYPEQFT